MQDTWTTVRYLDGYIRDALGNTGRVEITVWPDRRARVAFRIRPTSTLIVFERAIADWILPELFTHLREAGFPALPKHKPALGERVGLLSIASGRSTLQAWILRVHRQIPAMNRAMRLLEAIASALSGGSLIEYEADERPVLAPSPESRLTSPPEAKARRSSVGDLNAVEGEGLIAVLLEAHVGPSPLLVPRQGPRSLVRDKSAAADQRHAVLAGPLATVAAGRETRGGDVGPHLALGRDLALLGIRERPGRPLRDHLLEALGEQRIAHIGEVPGGRDPGEFREAGGEGLAVDQQPGPEEPLRALAAAS